MSCHIIPDSFREKNRLTAVYQEHGQLISLMQQPVGKVATKEKETSKILACSTPCPYLIPKQKACLQASYIVELTWVIWMFLLQVKPCRHPASHMFCIHHQSSQIWVQKCTSTVYLQVLVILVKDTWSFTRFNKWLSSEMFYWGYVFTLNAPNFQNT